MSISKNLISGSTDMLVLKLLSGQDMYGYQIIEELARRSDNTFELKTGTLYPLLHTLEEKQLVESYERDENTQRPRRYYHLTRRGHEYLGEKESEWKKFSGAVSRVMEGGFACVYA